MEKARKRVETTIFILRILVVCLVLLGSFLVANHFYILEQEENIIRNEKYLSKLELDKYREEQALLAKAKEEKEKEEIYTSCLAKPYQSSELENKITELTTKYQNYNLSFYFEDITNGYTIKSKETTVYFGASVIKLVEVLYLLNEAMAGRVDLNTTMTYEKRHQYVYSDGMSQHNIGEEITLKEIMTHAISVSDNTAHMMLYEYIGLDKIREYAKSINVETTISNNDKFGNLRAIDGYNILKEAYRILSLNNEYSQFLKNIMDNDYYNSLNFEEVRYLHKYGLASKNYNDIGIYFNDEPYLLSVFTRYAYDDYKTIVSTLSKEIYEIYKMNTEEKENYCQKQKENYVYKEL